MQLHLLTDLTRRAILGLSLALAAAVSGCGDDSGDGNSTAGGALAESRDGKDGRDGEDGEDGAPGEDGDDGKPGAQGEMGAPGAPDASGSNGRNGTHGKDGKDGADGATGAMGAPGQDGEDGVDGMDGKDGKDGVGAPEPQAHAIALSTTGHDRLYGVTHDADGNIYATGQLSSGIDAASDYAMMVVKFTPDGDIDASFGNDGIAVKNVAVGGTNREVARGIVVQSTGKIVIAGAAEHNPKAAGVLANDTDVVLVRFNADGTLDTTFGTLGVVVLDLSTGLEGVTTAMPPQPTLIGGDSQWALALASGDKLVVHGTQRAEGLMPDNVTPRSDADWALLRLSADGVLDATFGGGDGKVTLDIGGAGASARAVTVLSDDSIIGTGYLNSEVLGQASQQPVLYKVTAAGDFDATFATTDVWTQTGVWHDFAVQPPLRAEAYGAAVQGDHLVTMGYGPTPTVGGAGSDWVSFRFSLSGARDLTYGTNGTTYLDPGGYADNGRFVLVLPDNRVLGVGGGRRATPAPLPMGESPEGDGMVGVLTEDGAPDATFAAGGFQLYDMGGAGDFFWAADISPDQTQVAIVGIAGAEVAGLNDDDGALLLLPIDN